MIFDRFANEKTSVKEPEIKALSGDNSGSEAALLYLR